MQAILGLSPDITTKAWGTRKRFTRKLTRNLQRALGAHGLTGDVRWTLSRLHLRSDDPRALLVAQRTFGVHSVMPCRETPLEGLERLVESGHDLVAEKVRGKRFAVRGRVRDPSAGFRGQDINERLGAALVEHGCVDLDDPEVTVRVEVRDGTVWFFTDVLRAEGGLPVGVGGRALSLLSGGFDSSVASYRVLRRGVALDFLCLRLGGDAHERAVVAVANHLARQWFPGLRARLLIVPFEEAVERMRAVVEPRYWQLALKLLMYRAARAAADRTRAEALVTGEALGQVSTQTLPNLRALDASIDLPVLRPLLTEDKLRILEQAKHVGTHDVSARVPEYCALDAKKPATAATARELANAAAGVEMDLQGLLDASAWLDLPTRVPEDREALEIHRVPDAARVLDIRSEATRRREPMPDAVQAAPLDLLDHPERLDASVEYVVVCDMGSRSAWLARKLRDLGYRAWALRPTA
ncbi:MAG: THUMP domain-containing protein [Myxococcota bacterium]